MRTKIGQQGEVVIFKIEEIPSGVDRIDVERNKNGLPIVSHSEKGHHHVVDGAIDVMESTNDVPEGMRILYALLDKPGSLIQDATHSHGAINLDPGAYEFRIVREFNPFEEEIRQVAD